MTPEPVVPTAAPSVRVWVYALTVAIAVLIAVLAFWMSFSALTALAARAGIPEAQAWAWPVSVDGLIIAATCAAVALRDVRRDAAYAWFLLVVGASLSLTANLVHGALNATAELPTWVRELVAGTPPLMLVAIVHLLVLLARRRAAPLPAPSKLDVATSSAPHVAELAQPTQGELIPQQERQQPVEPVPTAAKTATPKSPVRAHATSSRGAEKAPLADVAAFIIETEAAGGEITGPAVAAHFGISDSSGRRRAREARAYIEEHSHAHPLSLVESAG